MASCFHTGYFLLRTLRPLAEAAVGGEVDAADDFDKYVDDFCDNYADVLPQRTTFVKAIADVAEPAAFEEACFAQLALQPTLN